jgi:hypothetical protein
MRIIGLLAALSITLFACGDDGGNDASNGAGGGSDQVCAAITDVQDAVTRVQELDSNSSIADVEDALSDVAQAGEQLASAIGDATPDADLSGLERSVQELDDALKAIPSSESIEAGLDDVEKAADSVAEEAKEAVDDIGCP